MVFLLAVLAILLVPLSAVLVSKAGKVATGKIVNSALVPVLEKTVRDVLRNSGISAGKIGVSGVTEKEKSLVFSCRIEAPQPVTQRVVNQIKEQLKSTLEKDTVSLKVTTDLVVGSEAD